MAEVVLQQQADREGLDIEVSSSAITGWEVGNPIDPRGIMVLEEAGYDVPDRGAQRLTVAHVQDYDLILAMTDEHKRAIDKLVRRVPKSSRPEVRMYREFASDGGRRRGSALDVPDPWYGDLSDFHITLNTLEDATPNLIEHIKAQG